MGRLNYKKVIQDFISSIPSSKLAGGVPEANTVYEDRYMRLDNQRTFEGADGLMYYNLQVQVDGRCPDTTLRKLAPGTVAMCHAPVEEPWSEEMIREELGRSVTGFGL